MLDDAQKARYQELKAKVTEGGKGGFMKLDKLEREEYIALNDMVLEGKEPTFTKTYVIGILDSLFKTITDGGHRAVILKFKREIQAHE